MARKSAVPPVELRLGGKTRYLKIDFNALASMEEKSGKSVMDFGTWKNMTLRDVRLMVWAAMLFSEPSITEEEVGKMIHPGNLAKVMTVVVETWKRSIPTSKHLAESPGPFVVPQPSQT